MTTMTLNEARELSGLVPKALAISVAAASQERQRNADPMIPPTSKTALARQARQDGVAQIAELQVIAQRADAAIAAFVAQASASWADGGGTEGELKRQAAWARTRPLLGNNPDQIAAKVEAAAKDALQRGDTSTLEALRREAPAHAQAIGAPLPAETIRGLDLTSGSPVAVHARQLEDRAKVGAYRVTTALGLISETLKSDGDLPAVAPGFGPTEEYHSARHTLTPQAVTA
jgi:hypothetical protein